MSLSTGSVLLAHVGLVLLHALWQVALLALVAALALRLLRKRSPQVRYAWACGFLGLMVLVPALTWVGVRASITTGSLNAPFQPKGVQALAPVLGTWSLSPDLLPILGVAWCLGTAIMLARLGGGLLVLERVYVHRARPAPQEWQQRLQILAQRAGVRSRLRLFLSVRAETPLVVGWLRPLILVPASALLHLGPEALEAVLAHELAHIRRHDYLVNLLQSVAEALLFFHPGAWWLNRQIRELREHCCDDEAVALTGGPEPLAEGLSLLALLRRRPFPQPALGATKGPILARIHRLLQPGVVSAPSRSLAMLAMAGSVVTAQAVFGHRTSEPTTPPALTVAPKPPMGAPPAEEPPKARLLAFDQMKVRHQPLPPKYPAAARIAKIQGVVVLEVLVNEAGIPERVTPLEGPPELHGTSVTYALTWRFQPTLVDGRVVKTRFKLTMPFKLQ